MKVKSRSLGMIWKQRLIRFLPLPALTLMLSIATMPAALGQGGNLGGFGTLGGVEPTGQYPPQQYYIALEIYRSGDMAEAIDAFEQSLRGGRLSVRGRWIDSIPALTMLAECNWQLGNLVGAREYLDQVFQIAIANRGWLGRTQWRDALQAGVQRTPPSYLWPEALAVQRVPVADRIQFQSGERLTEARLRQGGEIEEFNVRTMDVVEITRALALASYRRRMILGPLSDGDPVASGLINSTKYPANLQVPLGRTLIGAMRTSIHFSNFDDRRTLEEGTKYGLFGGGAHPLSPVTMLSQISALTGAEKVDAVVPASMNLVHVAAALEQPEFIGEAMQLAAGCANPTQAASVRQAATTVATAMFRKSRLAAMHCLIAGADAAITAGDLDSAVTMLSQAQAMGARRDVMLPRLDAYRAYVGARFAAARGSCIGIAKPTDLDEALNQIGAFALHHRIRNRSLVSTPRIYQLNLIRQSIGKSLGGKTSDALLKAYSMDPPIDVWRRDAVDALSAVMTDRTVTHLTRVNLAASAGYGEPFLAASDLMLGAKFVQRLPLGGRVAQVRALAAYDDALLDPALVEYRKKMGKTMAELRALALAADQGDPVQADAFESKACFVALSRMPIPHCMPPPLDEKVPLANLPERSALLTFTVAGNNVHATLAAGGKAKMWTVSGGARLPAAIGRMLKEIGVGKTRGERLPTDQSWRETATAIRRQLIPDENGIAWNEFDELIVVPDGPLWYLPFELLSEGDETSSLLGDVVSIRYAPTPGLALKTVAPKATSRAIGLSAELFFAPRDPDQNEAIVQTIVDVINDPVRLPQSEEIPTSLLADKVGHVIVAAPRNANTKSPLMMSVAPYDQNSAYGTLAAWLRYPTATPRSVALFGMRTPVGIGKVGSGDEIFMTLCGLHAAGVRSVLLSRWAVGGESSAIAIRELVQELPFTGMNAAWGRAKSVLRRSELDPSAEPLLIQAEHDREGLTGDEPLFWSGYLVSSPHVPAPE